MITSFPGPAWLLCPHSTWSFNSIRHTFSTVLGCPTHLPVLLPHLPLLSLLCWPHCLLLTSKFLYYSELEPCLLSFLVIFSPYLISSRPMGLNATHILMNSKNRVLDMYLQLSTCPFKPVYFPALPSQSMTQGLNIPFPSCFTSSPLTDPISFAFWIYLQFTYIFCPHSFHSNSSHHQFYLKLLASSKFHWSS